MTDDRIVTAAEAASWADDPRPRLGGKGASLAALARAGIPAPPWIALTTSVFRDVRAAIATDVNEALTSVNNDDASALDAASARIASLFRQQGLSAADRERLYSLFDATFARDALVAVRSSAVGEDSAKDSFAGQMDTYLFVTRERLEERVLSCMASAYAARALLYRKVRGVAGAVEACVLVQLMIDARAAGVLFSANPTTGDLSEVVISAGLGLGEGAVGDLVETDTVFADLSSGAIRERMVADKRGRIGFDREKGGGTRHFPVAPETGDLPAISDAEVAALVAIGRRIAEGRGKPQDIEWAIDAQGALHVLQARDVTTLLAGRETIFDNANVVESYPGLSSPLTFSFARAAYEATFRESSRSFGIPEWALLRWHHAHANLIGLVEGRIYYNILHWYRLYQLVPGLEGLLPAWEKALGLTRRFVRPPARASLLVRIRRAPMMLRILGCAVAAIVFLQRRVRRFERLFAEVHAGFRARRLDDLDAQALLELHDEVVHRLLGPYSISVVNDLITQQMYEKVRRSLLRYRIAADEAEADALRNDLLCGEKGMESVEPVRSALALAASIRGMPALRALFEEKRPDAEVWAAIHSGSAFTAFRAELATHLERYGDRTLHELKLETLPAEENPSFVISTLRNFVRGGQDVTSMEARERTIRDAADTKVRGRLAGHPLRRLLFGRLLARTRQGVKDRENLRLLRSRAFGMVKRIFRALGRQLAKAGVIDDAGDVFWLAVEEVMGAVRGTNVTRDLRPAIAQRKREYEGYAQRRPAPRVSVRGIVAAAAFRQAGTEAGISHAGAATELRGMGCSPGIVRGRAKVILSPEQDLTIAGEILIAPMTDPGWVFLMVAAKGIVSEKGSLLSHTAIIGRELGIPTVVGVKDATRRIRDGAEIEIDGQAGIVRVISPTSHPSRT